MDPHNEIPGISLRQLTRGENLWYNINNRRRCEEGETRTMGMTIKELAAELGVSKEAIRKHVAKLPSDHVSHGKRGVISLTDDAVAIIRQQIATYISPTTNNEPPTGTGENACGLNDDRLSETITDNLSLRTANNKLTTDNQRLQTELQTANDKIQLLSDNLQDLREQLKQKNAELEAKNKQISDLLQALQAEQILHGQMLQLEPPKRKWYEVFKSKKGSEQK